MAAAWITRDRDGIVNAAYIAAYATPDILRAWRRDGRTPELVDFGPDVGCKIGGTLPETAKIIDTF